MRLSRKSMSLKPMAIIPRCLSPRPRRDGGCFMIGPPRLPILLWLLGLVLSVTVIARTSFTTDMSAFLPSSPEPAQQILVDKVKDGVASRLILVGLEGSTAAMRAVLSRTIGTALRARDEFALVENGADEIGKTDQDYVWSNRYLLNPDVVRVW